MPNLSDILQDNGTTPAGMIKAFGGSSAPAGWLVCEGTLVSRSTYARLFAAIGTNFGSGDGSTTFALPDLRGRFLRGHNDSSGTDPDAGSRTALSSGGNTGDAVGSLQGGETAINSLGVAHDIGTSNTNTDHTHSAGVNPAFHGTYTGQGTSGYVGPGSGTSSTSGMSSNATHAHGITGGVYFSSGGSETRPTNVSVKYIIKT